MRPSYTPYTNDFWDGAMRVQHRDVMMNKSRLFHEFTFSFCKKLLTAGNVLYNPKVMLPPKGHLLGNCREQMHS